eukprot:805202-Alexandrium_andersonii.AAC.1
MQIFPDAQGPATFRNRGCAEAELAAMELDPVCSALCCPLILTASPATHDVPPTRPQLRRHARRNR